MDQWKTWSVWGGSGGVKSNWGSSSIQAWVKSRSGSKIVLEKAWIALGKLKKRVEPLKGWIISCDQISCDHNDGHLRCKVGNPRLWGLMNPWILLFLPFCFILPAVPPILIPGYKENVQLNFLKFMSYDKIRTFFCHPVFRCPLCELNIRWACPLWTLKLIKDPTNETMIRAIAHANNIDGGWQKYPPTSSVTFLISIYSSSEWKSNKTGSSSTNLEDDWLKNLFLKEIIVNSVVLKKEVKV